MKRMKDIKDKNHACGCRIRTSCGLPCACEISSYVDERKSIPLDSINIFWKRLDFSPALLYKGEPELVCHEELDKFKEAYDKETRPMVKRSWLQKLKGIWDPSSTNYDEPAVQTKTRGRPTTKTKKQQKKSDPPPPKPPLQRSYSQKPSSHSLFGNAQECDYPQDPPRHSSFVTSQESYYTKEQARPSFFGNPEAATQSSFEYLGLPTYSSFKNNDDYFVNPLSTPGYDFMGLHQDTGEIFRPILEKTPGYDFMGLHQDTGEIFRPISEKYIEHLPEIFRPYVTRIHNVLGDGNCGFRATTSALGYGEDQWLEIRSALLEELLEFREEYTDAFCGSFENIYTSLCWSGPGFAPGEHWMIMPKAGFLIANRFNVIVHFISEVSRNSSTCFSLWRGPDQFPQKKVITIAHVNGDHFIMVELQGEYPMATTNNLWTLKRGSSAAGWENVFKSRQDMYRAWVAQPAEFVKID